MRLTLRTLLAYLDDTLEPAETKEIGQKIAESSTAQDLINRIKQVTRRRRLGSPPLAGPGTKFDAETVAGYLDGTLSGEAAAEIEKLCLDSDVHLAEIAACHQIRTLVSGEEAMVPPMAKRRMYTLVRGREAVQPRKVPPAKSGIHRAEPLGADLRADDNDSLLGIPQYRQGPGWLRWALPIGAVVLLVGVCVAIYHALSGPTDKGGEPRGGHPVAQNTGRAPSTEPASNPKPPDGNPPDNPPPNTGTDNPNPPDTKPPDTTPPDTVPPDTTPPAQPTGNWVDRPNNERTAVGKVVPVAEKVPAILVHRPLGLQGKEPWQGWQRKSANAAVSSGDELVALPGYRAQLLFNKGVEAYLWGNVPFVQMTHLPLQESSVTVHKSDKYDLDLTLNAGRMLLSNRKPSGPATIRVRFYDEPGRKEAWDVTLAEPNATVGLELLGRYPPGSPFQAPAEPSSSGSRIKTGSSGQGDRPSPGGTALAPLIDLYLVVLSGRAAVKVDEYRSWNDLGDMPDGAAGPSLLEWNNYGQGAQRPLPLGPEAKKRFWDRQPPVDPSPVRARLTSALDALEKTIKDQAQVDVALVQLTNSTQPENQMIGALGLGAIDDLPRLIDALGDIQPGHVELRNFASLALKQWIGQGSRNDEKLYQTLLKKYKKTEAEAIMQMLHGYSMVARQQKETLDLLVQYLKHPKPAVRQMAFVTLGTLVPEGRDIAYSPLGDSVQMDAGYKAWKKLAVDQPLPPMPPPPPGSGGPGGSPPPR